MGSREETEDCALTPAQGPSASPGGSARIFLPSSLQGSLLAGRIWAACRPSPGVHGNPKAVANVCSTLFPV